MTVTNGCEPEVTDIELVLHKETGRELGCVRAERTEEIRDILQERFTLVDCTSGNSVFIGVFVDE